MKAGVLKGIRQLDDGLADILDLLLARHLDGVAVSSVMEWFDDSMNVHTYRHWDAVRGTRKLHGYLKEACWRLKTVSIEKTKPKECHR
jgi:hypothetical protein